MQIYQHTCGCINKQYLIIAAEAQRRKGIIINSYFSASLRLSGK